MRHKREMISVTIFTVVMLLVAAGLVVVFGQFRFASSNTYHANFTDASRLKAGEDVRIAGVQVGSVKSVKLKSDNTVDVKFTLNERYQLYTSSRALVRYQNLVGDRYLEIASGPGELRKLPPAAPSSSPTPSRRLTSPSSTLAALLRLRFAFLPIAVATSTAPARLSMFP